MLGKSKIRLGVGFRLTKKNAIYMSIILLFYYMLQLCLYICVIYFWLIYATVYGIYIFIRWIIRKIKAFIEKQKYQASNEIKNE